MEDATVLEENRKLAIRVRELEEENRRLKVQIERYVGEFRVCRFCAHVRGDCSPTDGSCAPKWRGL